jgi:hypothetical protein
VGFNTKNQKAQFEILNGNNAYIFSSNYFGQNPAKQTYITINSDINEIVKSTDIVSSITGWATNFRVIFGGGSNYYIYMSYDSSTNTNRMISGPNNSFFKDYFDNKYKNRTITIPSDYGGWIPEDGYASVLFQSGGAKVSYNLFRYRFQNVGATNQYLNDYGSTKLTCTTVTNDDKNPTLFYLYKMENGWVHGYGLRYGVSNSLPFLIKNIYDKKWLNHNGGTSTVNGIQMLDNDMGQFSQWNLLRQVDGSFVIKNVASTYYIECDSTNTSQIYCRSQIINNYSKWKILDGLTTTEYFDFPN